MYSGQTSGEWVTDVSQSRVVQRTSTRWRTFTHREIDPTLVFRGQI